LENRLEKANNKGWITHEKKKQLFRPKVFHFHHRLLHGTVVDIFNSGEGSFLAWNDNDDDGLFDEWNK